MIEIQARLVRESSAVFLAGEIVECIITFTNIPRSSSPTAFAKSSR